MGSLAAGMLDRARGALLGLAVGDALGGPLEFLSADEIRAHHGAPVRDYIGGGWLALEAGHGTDDTALALALARSAATSIGYDPGRALAAYLEWFRSDPPDVGATTRAALAAADAGIATTLATVATEEFHQHTGRTAGNGSLMRVAPIALRHFRESERRARAARTDSKLTHYDDHAADACAWLCDVIAALLAGVDPAELAAPVSLEREWEVALADAAVVANGPAAGHVGTTLGVASAALRTADSFEEGLVWAVNLGGDADTNGAVAGALLGARFGASKIPSHWLEQLAVKDEADALAERLLVLGQQDIRPDNRAQRRRRATSSLDAAARLKAALEPFAGRLGHDPEAKLAAEWVIADSGAFREGPISVSNVPDRDVLYVLERGYVDDGLERERKLEICEHVSLILDLDRRRCVGFIFGKLSDFDFEAPASSVVWSGPRFDVPALGVEQGTVGLVAATARLVLGELRTPDRVLFDAAVRTEDSIEALTLWEACLDEGNELARYALGYTLLALGRAREAHEQLKRYSSRVRRNAWAWCYLGQACEQLEDSEGAEYAYRQALESTDAGSFDTDADERLAALLHRLAPLRPELSP
ncbi:MAG: ADP-ribosylglycohydrolase family protein [Solirubrobacteraceae bacterium]